MELNKKVFYTIFFLQVLILFSSSYFIRLDDAYIFYNYAKNLTEGNGYVFNLNEKINATTSFIYTIVLSIFYLPFRSNPELLFPLFGNFISITSLLITSLILMKLFSTELNEAKYILPLIIFSMPFIKNAIGMETFFKLMLIILFLYLFKKNKFLLMSFTGGILVLTRPDTIILVIATMFIYILKFKNLPGYLSFNIFLVTILTYTIFSQLYFGSVVPTSVNIKILQQELEIINGNFWQGFLINFPKSQKLAIIFYSLIIVGFIYLITKKHPIIKNETFQILIGYLLVYTLVYGLILNPPPYPWYYIDYIVIYSLILVSVLKLIIEKLDTHHKQIFMFLIALTFFILGSAISFKSVEKGFNEKFLLYRTTALFLNSISNETTKLATDEIGIFGFYFNGKIVDELGLITPEAIVGIRNKNFSSTIEITKPDFVIVDFPNYPKYKSYIKTDWFKQNYSEFYTLIYFNSGLKVYKKS